MCRLMVYKGPRIALSRLILDPPHGLYAQASHAKEMLSGPLNADGFGVGWFDQTLDAAPGLYRSTQPIWTDINVSHLLPRLGAELFFGHVRAASDGMPVSITNTHPFVHRNLLFMHNGFVDRFRERVLADLSKEIHADWWPVIKGNTDAEHLFAVFLSQLRDPDRPSPEDLERAFRRMISVVENLAAKHTVDVILNIAVSNGEHTLVSRHHNGTRKASLYLLDHGPEHPDAVLVASERAFESSAWHVVPEKNLLQISAETLTEISPL